MLSLLYPAINVVSGFHIYHTHWDPLRATRWPKEKAIVSRHSPLASIFLSPPHPSVVPRPITPLSASHPSPRIGSWYWPKYLFLRGYMQDNRWHRWLFTGRFVKPYLTYVGAAALLTAFNVLPRTGVKKKKSVLNPSILARRNYMHFYRRCAYENIHT